MTIQSVLREKELFRPFLHAGVFCPAHNRKKLEHLCRYISRPSLSEARLSLNTQGQVVYKLKTVYRIFKTRRLSKEFLLILERNTEFLN